MEDRLESECPTAQWDQDLPAMPHIAPISMWQEDIPTFTETLKSISVLTSEKIL